MNLNSESRGKILKVGLIVGVSAFLIFSLILAFLFFSVKSIKGLPDTSSPPISKVPARLRPLFVLDINGTLLDRLTSQEEKGAFRANPPDDYMMLELNNIMYVFRPYLREFLQVLFNRGEVAIWSSMKMEDTAFVSRLVLSSRPSQFIWSRQECDSIPVAGKLKPLLRKPLDLIWSKFPKKFTTQNTIMIDDTRAKLELHLENHLHIPEYHVCPGNIGLDTVLKVLAQRIEHLPEMDDYRKAIPSLCAGLSSYSVACPQNR